jgi:hypothetical protein
MFACKKYTSQIRLDMCIASHLFLSCTNRMSKYIKYDCHKSPRVPCAAEGIALLFVRYDQIRTIIKQYVVLHPRPTVMEA